MAWSDTVFWRRVLSRSRLCIKKVFGAICGVISILSRGSGAGMAVWVNEAAGVTVAGEVEMLGGLAAGVDDPDPVGRVDGRGAPVPGGRTRGEGGTFRRDAMGYEAEPA